MEGPVCGRGLGVEGRGLGMVGAGSPGARTTPVRVALGPALRPFHPPDRADVDRHWPGTGRSPSPSLVLPRSRLGSHSPGVSQIPPRPGPA